ncbi:MAG: transglycosylase domain-containing protein [Bdellovibrionales bacterium]|nr:transglycosylase domain-containing protein [Bdellovibrionales bacterium]
MRGSTENTFSFFREKKKLFVILLLFASPFLFEGLLAYSQVSFPILRCQQALPPQSVPSKLLSAILAQEDQLYFSHRGINIREFYRSLKANLSAGRVVRGASTISMQVASLCYSYTQTPSRWYSKIREVFLALFLDRRLTKARILEMYLLGAPLGDDPETIGFLSAGKSYFEKPATKWSEREIWSLVTALRNREFLNPEATRKLHVISERTNRKLLRARSVEPSLHNMVLENLSQVSWVLPLHGPLQEEQDSLTN